MGMSGSKYHHDIKLPQGIEYFLYVPFKHQIICLQYCSNLSVRTVIYSIETLMYVFVDNCLDRIGHVKGKIKQNNYDSS